MNKLDLKEKKIFFVISPHINYYHSYRGDSRGRDGFGTDLTTMRAILDKLDEIEEKGFSFKDMKITWDYGDTFWSIQLQQEYQQDVLERVIERCKKGKDEVLIGSWGNVAKPMLDSEEFVRDHEWFLENEMGIGLKQLFPGRIAPYARTQETMFTQGMIELYNKIGVEGICIYYCVYPFDVGRPFLNPRLNTNQRYGLVKFNSSISDASMIMIPMYAFGDVVDYFSIKRWFKLIRKMQEKGEITGHALLFFNFDMDVDLWLPQKLPKFLQWMPKTRGLIEFAEAVDLLDYVEFANLLDVIPKLKIHGETTLYPDAADGLNNGFYNWAQKYDNTKLWTIGQRARWQKCISDTLISQNMVENKKANINNLIRNEKDSSESYIKNKILLASTTNFGLSVPFMHPTRIKTGMAYALKAHNAAENAVNLAIDESFKYISNRIENNDYNMIICPILNRGITEQEKSQINSSVLIKTKLPQELSNELLNNDKGLNLRNFKYGLYDDNSNHGLFLEAIVPKEVFESEKIYLSKLSLNNSANNLKNNGKIKATIRSLQNEIIELILNDNGLITSFNFNGVDLACPNFLESAVTFGESKNGKRYHSNRNRIEILRDGSDGFSASIKIYSKFEILRGYDVQSEKILILYSGVPAMFVDVKMKLCDIIGESTIEDGHAYVAEKYDNRWQEVIPCEIKPNLIGNNEPLRIWKRNFLGRVSYFDLDIREVDSRNKNIDNLVSNISDGWMAVSDRKNGILVGFNSLKASNFAFSPLKIKDKGFGDGYKKGQQVRINPFGNYYGKILHYWTTGSGRAYKIAEKFLTHQDQPTAPTYNGKTLNFDLIIAPYKGDKPPESVQSLADHFSLPPLVIIGKKDKMNLVNNLSHYGEIAESIKREYEIDDLMNLSYLEWVRKVNENFDPNAQEEEHGGGLPLSIGDLIMMLIDGIRGR